ncbi:ABC transporter permease [Paenibacillus sp.]|uniref:ABC transporter permease n=1 Tax=Paenibacillus sp. TaxID=58172 RepID=UPI00356A019F
MVSFILDLMKNRKMIWTLAIKDVQTKYLGSVLGIVWAFVQPTISILIYWFVFQIGFKSTPVGDIPFVLWLLTGLVPWFFISESISSASNSIIENSYLVKKIVFRVSTLPIIKIISSLSIHVFFIVVLFVFFICYGYALDLYVLQVIYYLIASVILVLGISWITSTLVVFLKDVGQLIGMGLNFFFWLTPIFWNMSIVSDKYIFLFKLNPFFYIIEGYRQTFIYKEWFWEHPFLTAYYWIITLVILSVGVWLFKKLRPHFADVL